MLLYDNFTIALRYSVKLAFSQFARVVQNFFYILIMDEKVLVLCEK